MRTPHLLNMKQLVKEVEELTEYCRTNDMSQNSVIDNANIDSMTDEEKFILFSWVSAQRTILQGMEADAMLSRESNAMRRITSGATLYPVIMCAVSLGYSLAMHERSIQSMGLKPNAVKH